jgi:hypothetical protein
MFHSHPMKSIAYARWRKLSDAPLALKQLFCFHKRSA